MISGHNKKIISIAVVLVAILVSLVVTKKSQAQGVLPFGGLVTNSFYCTATNNFLLTVVGPAGGTFVYDPEFHPQAYDSYNLGFGQTGMWVLGLYDPNPLGCWMQAAPSDFPIHSTGIITPTVGTSPTF